ncbi:PREDICTED: proteoglycan 4-like [Branchiostoma belcheri]|uniref:Proteoglycan 4-like n=1 Tax=Branchiostoma belcheri TaxID=7741 RepID=A0A6P4YXY1_BRABE|nr:PREDICTED: proteoglycan 4-like [Branchiostoma belcheri]
MALSNGQIVGISVGVILFVVFLILVPLYCYFVWRKRRREAGYYESEEEGQPSATSPPPHSEKKGAENLGYEINGDEVNGAVNHGKVPDNGVVQSNGPVSVETPAKIEIETQQKSVPEKPDEISLDIPEESVASSKSPDVRRDSDALSRSSLNSDLDLDNISLKMRGLGDTDDILTSVMSVKSPFNFDEQNVSKDAEVTPEVKDESNRMFDFDSLGKDTRLSENDDVPEVIIPNDSNVPQDRSKLYQVSDIPGNDLAPRENLSFDLERSDSLSLSSASSKETIIEMPGFAQRDASPHLEQNTFQGDTTFGEELTLSDLEEDLNSWEIEQPVLKSIEPLEVDQLVLQRADISQVEVNAEEQVDKSNVEPEVEIQIEKAAEVVEMPDDVIPNGHDVEPMTLGVEMASDSDSGSDVPTCSITMAAEDSSSTDASAGENDGTVSVRIPERTSLSDDKVTESDTLLSLDKTPPAVMGDSFATSIFSTLDSGVPKQQQEPPPSLNEEPEVTVLSFRNKDGGDDDDDSVSLSSASSGSSGGSKGDVLKESLAVEEPHSPPFSPITPLRKKFFSPTPEIGMTGTQMTSSPLQLEPETGEARTVTDKEPPWKSFDLSPTSKKEVGSELETVAKVDEVSSQVSMETTPEPEVGKIDEQFEEKALTFATPDESRVVADSASSEASSSESERPNVDSDAPEQTVTTETPLETEKVENEPATVTIETEKVETPQMEKPLVVQESKAFESVLERPSFDRKAPEPTVGSPSVSIGGDPTDDVVSSVGSALTSWKTRKPWRTRGRLDDDSSSGRSTPESEKAKDASFFSSLLGTSKEDAIKDLRSNKKRSEVTRSDSRTPRFKYTGFSRTYQDEEEDLRKGDAFSSPTANLEGRLAAKTETESQKEEQPQVKLAAKEIEDKLSESTSLETPLRKNRHLNSPDTTSQPEQASETPPRRKIDDIIQHLNNRSEGQKSAERTVDQSPSPEPVPVAHDTPYRPPLPSPDHLTPSQRQLAQQESVSSAAPSRPPLPSTPNLSRTESYKALTPEQQSEIISAKSTPRTTKDAVQEGTPMVAATTPKVADTTPNVAEATPKIPDSTPRILDTTAPKVPEATPKVADSTPKVSETTPKVPETTPKARDTRKFPARTRDKPPVSKLSPARLSPYTPMPFSRDRHTSPPSVSTTPPSAGVAKGRRPRGVARFMSSSSNPLFHAAMLLNDEENKKNASAPDQEKKNESLRNGRGSSPSLKTSPAPQEQSPKPSPTAKTESEGVKAPPRKSRGSDPATNGESEQSASGLRKDSALLRTPSSVSRASEDGSEYGEAVSVALDDAFAMLDDI